MIWWRRLVGCKCKWLEIFCELTVILTRSNTANVQLVAMLENTGLDNVLPSNVRCCQPSGYIQCRLNTVILLNIARNYEQCGRQNIVQSRNFFCCVRDQWNCKERSPTRSSRKFFLEPLWHSCKNLCLTTRHS